MPAKSIACCGLSCATCAIYQAHTRGDKKLQKIALSLYRKILTNSPVTTLELEDIRCEGCRSDLRFKYCQSCEIRECCQTKGHRWCFQCDDFPCTTIEKFPVQAAKALMLESGENCRAIGPDAWTVKVMKRHTCEECGTLMFRGATRCMHCKARMDRKQ